MKQLNISIDHYINKCDKVYLDLVFTLGDPFRDSDGNLLGGPETSYLGRGLMDELEERTWAV